MESRILTHLGDMPVPQFLAEYWQRKPLLIRNALASVPRLEPDILAGYSLEEGVESRLILERPKGRNPLLANWRMKHGPLEPDAFNQLPKSHWTLLVQAVNLLDPAMHELLHRFRFLPNWRVDDIMVSYAVDGGGVGPHFDYYDVFLLQASGRRLWRLGQKCDADSPLREDTPCKILKDFATTEEWTLDPGDLLYIPPQVAHWGIAQGECMTYSIGFRAPSLAEMLLEFSQEMASDFREDQRFTDAGRPLPGNPGLISEADLAQARTHLRALLDDDARLADWFGRFMTQPQRESLHFEQANPVPRLAPQMRAAYQPTVDDRAHLYINGEQFTASLRLAQSICAYEPIRATSWVDADRRLVEHLLAEAYLV